MSIKALPTDTRRLIGATSLIASPVCLVRELVDNAIDARASCVDVLMSRNTVDKVEVRDNGTGIAHADFAVLGRPSHSSKHMSSGTDASGDGAPTLGFRGEGLASANGLGYVAVTTRTSADADAVATTFRLVPNTGGIAPGSQRATPAPVGTTITVTCLFAQLPVRRKTAIHDAAKTVAAIKTLLRGYALARPDLRLSLKVVQPGETVNAAVIRPESAAAAASAPFYYRPAAVGMGGRVGMKQAVAILFGVDAARQCQEVVASSRELLSGKSVPPTESESADAARDFVFKACLPQPGANVAKLKLGSFVSVDGRPLSDGTYGSTAQKLAAIFTKAFQASQQLLQSQPQPKVQGLFFRVNIRCPSGSYDANVAPSKTDVLFADEHVVCDAFARLCKRVYETEAVVHGCSQPFPSTPLRTPTVAEASPVRIQIGSLRHGGGNRRHLLSAPRQRAASLRTPPASPLEARGQNRQNHNNSRGARPAYHPGLPGLMSSGDDGLRQTTISFHGPRVASSATPAQGQPPRIGRMSRGPSQAAGSATTQHQTTSDTRGSQLPGALTLTVRQTTSTSTSSRTQIMSVNLQQLRRSVVRLVRHVRACEKGADDGDGDGQLSPEMADITSIEARLRGTIAAWLARTRAGGERVQVELYLRKSLKQKALTMGRC